MARHKRPIYVHAYNDRHGKARIYFNKPGTPKIALPGPLYSEQFWIAYHKAMAGVVEPKAGVGSSRTVAGTFSDLISQYYGSAAFTSKAVATQRNYKSSIEPFRKEHGDKPVSLIKAKHIDALLGEIAKRSTAQAHNLRKRLLKLMALAVKWEFRADNPMLDVDRVQHKTKGYETWSDLDIGQFRTHWPVGSAQRIAFEVLLYTGLRRSDVVRLGRQHIKDGHIAITARKTGAQLHIPIHPEFRAVLDTIKHGHLVFIATVHGAARSEFGLTNWVIEAAKAAGLPPHRSPHGLRKAACVRLADAGCDVFEIMSITGHTDMKEVQTYVAAANKKKQAMSAITKAFGAA